MCHALAVDIGETDFNPENVPSIGTILDCCQGLITVDAEASTLRLIHHTVQEYLCSHPGLFSIPHSILAETCLTYLNSQQVKNLTPNSLPDLESMPFLKYSARYWGAHTSRDLSDNTRTLALELLDQYEDHISALSLLEQVLPPKYGGATTTSPLFSGLHCASFFGIVELVTVLINSRGYKINQQDEAGRTPLVWAARNGHEGVVRLLLEQENVDPNCPDRNNTTPLGLAAVNGHEGVVKLLLECETVDPNRASVNDITPLSGAAFHGHQGVVKLLLEQGNVNPDHPTKNNATPIKWAARNGHEGVVKLLLEQENVNPNRPDHNNRTPLGWAAQNGHEGVVKSLLELENVEDRKSVV